MAGSYKHVIDGDGNLLPGEEFVHMIENLRDAYEAIEEMYGMIWWLVCAEPDPKGRIELARLRYEFGLEHARFMNGKRHK